jgi:pilus assembly protein CpaB
VNPRQRRGLTFIVVAMMVAVGTFVAVTSYTASVNSQVGSRVTVYRATQPIEAFTALSANNLEPTEIPQRWVSKTAILSLKDLQGRRIGFRLSSGTILDSDMLIPPSDLSPTEREVAINVNSVTGVAGRVRPGDRVDIYAVFADVPGLAKQVKVLVRNVRVVSIAGQQTVTQQGDKKGVSQESVVPVTLALESEPALSVTFSAAFAQEVRLVALPLDVGTNRVGEKDSFDAGNLGGKAVPEGTR